MKLPNYITKGPSGNNRATYFVAWTDCIVPFAVKLVAYDVDLRHFLIGHDDTFWIGFGVEFALHGQACIGGRGADEINDDAIADQRLGTPIQADKRKQAVLDFVPLAGAGRQVVKLDLDAKFVSQLLQFAFP